jgi:KDO2-lipid IV(A) lauroyltransferase
MKSWLEYAAAWTILKGLGLLPRRAAVAAGRRVGLAVYRLAGGLRRTGRRNLELAFPEKSVEERERILRGAFANLGRHLGEFSQLPKLRTPEDAYRTVRFEGRDRAVGAIASGRGVLFLTGHMGAWEMSPVGLRLSGSPPVNFLVRRIDNPRVEALADSYRTLCGNRTIDKRDAARPLLSALRRGEGVGILVDLNTLDREGVFVDFFGRPASTTSGLAVFALRTDAVVMPVFTYWDEAEGRYVLHFYEPVEVTRTGSKEDDIRENTQRFTKVVEDFVREHPDQWLWIHKRWKTRPPGDPGIY